MDIRIIKIVPVYQDFFAENDRLYVTVLQRIDIEYEIRDDEIKIQGVYSIGKDDLGKENLEIDYLKQKIKETLIKVIQEL